MMRMRMGSAAPFSGKSGRSSPQTFRRAGIPFQPRFEMALHVRPLMGEDAVHMHVAGAAVPARHVVSDDAVPLCAERFDRLLRRKIEIVRAQTHDRAAERFEGVTKQHQLATGVDVSLLMALRVP